jgi:hypothetical protein
MLTKNQTWRDWVAEDCEGKVRECPDFVFVIASFVAFVVGFYFILWKSRDAAGWRRQVLYVFADCMIFVQGVTLFFIVRAFEE